jgi:hypothetical protein
MLSIACKYLARLMHLRVYPSRFEVAAGFSRATLAPILTIEFHPQVSHLPVYQYNSELFHAARAFQTMQFHTCIVILYILLPPSKVALVNAAQGYHFLSLMPPNSNAFNPSPPQRSPLLLLHLASRSSLLRPDLLRRPLPPQLRPFKILQTILLGRVPAVKPKALLEAAQHVRHGRAASWIVGCERGALEARAQHFVAET